MAVTVRTQATTDGNSTTATVTLPTRTAGDLLVAVLLTADGGTAGTPTGWDLRVTSPNTEVRIYTREATNTAADAFSSTLGTSQRWGLSITPFDSSTGDGWDYTTIETDTASGASSTTHYAGTSTLFTNTDSQDQLVVGGTAYSGSKNNTYTAPAQTNSSDGQGEIHDYNSGTGGPTNYRGGGAIYFYWDTTAYGDGAVSYGHTAALTVAYDGASIFIETSQSGSPGTATPDTVTSTVTVPTPDISAAANVDVPAAVAATTTVPTPTAGASSPATVEPATVTATVDVPQPSFGLDLIIQTGTDDAWTDRDGPTWTDTTAFLWCGDWTSGQEDVCARWDNVHVPGDATIESATVTMKPRNDSPLAGGSNDVVITVSFDAADDSAMPTTIAQYDARTRTTNNGTLTVAASVTTDITSTDLSAALAEVTGRAGWTAGNAITALCDVTTWEDDVDFAFEPYELDQAECPRLSIVWTPAVGTTVTPATVAATTAVPTPTIHAEATVEPAAVERTFAVDTPTIHAAATVTPETVGLDFPVAGFSVDTPTIHAEATVTPAAVERTFAVDTPTIRAASTVEPATVAATAAVPTPTASAAQTVEPAAIERTFAVDTPTIHAAATVEPATVVSAATVPAPTIAVPKTVEPATVTTTVTVDTPAIHAAATVTPATVERTFVVDTPSILAASTVEPATVTATAAVPTPTASAAKTVTPATVAATAAVSTPTIVVAEDSTVTPAAVATAVTVPTPDISAGAVIIPATVAATTTVPTPTIGISGEVTPTTVTATAAVDTPTIHAAATVTPPAVELDVPVAGVSVDIPTIHAAATVTPATVAATVAVPAPSVAAEATVTPATVAAAVTVDTPDIAAEATVTPAAVTSTVTVPTPVASAGTVVQPAAVTATVTVPTPVASGAASATVTPATVAATVTVPTPTIGTPGTVTPATVTATVTVPTPTISVPSVIVQPAAVTSTVTVPAPTFANFYYAYTGFDIGRFYRKSTDQFILVVGLGRSAGLGYRRNEGWEQCSGRFAVPAGFRERAMDAAQTTWVANKATDSSSLATLVNTALHDAGYRRPNGAPIS